MVSLKDVCNEFAALFDNVVANIGFVTGSVPMLQLADQQIAYEGYSNVSFNLVKATSLLINC